METITNAASTVTSTVSNLIYGQPAKENETSTNETGGQEPLSGTQGKGTVNEPFDQGNAENPVSTSSATNTATPATGNTSYKEDDFLKLNPSLGQSASTGTTGASTGTTGESTIPIVPMNPESSTMGSGHSASTGITDKAGVTDKVWKSTDLDEVKASGAPGAGPAAPDYKAATPDTSLTSNTPTEHHSPAAVKDTTTSEPAKDSLTPKKENTDVETTHSDTAKAQESVGGPIEEILNKGTSSKNEHTVDDSEASDPHSKMSDKTTRATHASKTGETAAVETHPAETTTSHTSESSKAAEPASPSGGDEKSEKKMSQLKDKLKNKLHIGNKDK